MCYSLAFDAQSGGGGSRLGFMSWLLNLFASQSRSDSNKSTPLSLSPEPSLMSKINASQSLLSPTSFPQFGLLPSELRIQIFAYALLPTPNSVTINLSQTRWDAADTQAYVSSPFELDESSIWHFAFVPNRMPSILFTCKDAFIAAEPYYRHASCSGHEILDRELIPTLVNERSEVDTHRYSEYMPAVRERSELPLWIGRNCLLVVETSLKACWDSNSHLSSYAISALHPLIFSNVRHLFMNLFEFLDWVNQPASSGTLVFRKLEVLYLAAQIPVGSERQDLNVAMNDLENALFDESGSRNLRWGIKQVVYVTNMEDALKSMQLWS